MTLKRHINFSAGPAMLPDEVLQKINQSIFNWENQGVSILEIGHRTDKFYQLTQACKLNLKKLLNVPDTHDILFLPSGTTAHFSYIPQNFIDNFESIDYVDTGHWSQKAISQARKYANVNIVTSSKENNFKAIAAQNTWKLNKDVAFLHYVDNETIGGIEFPYTPESPYAPLVSDMTSSILSKPIDISKYGAIYAGAQKNLGIAGISVLIVDINLLQRSSDKIPDVFNYQKIAQAESLYSTPAIFAWYVLSLMLEWAIAQGGVDYFYQQSLLKSSTLYQYIDQSSFYFNSIHPDYRSRMNVIFNLKNKVDEARFIASAEKAGITGIKGHRSSGGMRVSLYNTITVSDVNKLITFMDAFAK